VIEGPDLPPEYLDWLDALPGPCYVVYRGREWDVATRARLTEVLRVNRDRVPYHAQLGAYVAMWRGNGHAAADGPGRKPFPYPRLAGGVVIGTDNGDPLFVDPGDGYSVWMLRLDSTRGKVERVAPSIRDWVDHARPSPDDLGDGDEA
jgi:hypothetical protein